MIDIQTYRVRIGSAPIIIGRILSRKAAGVRCGRKARFGLRGGETHKHEDLRRKSSKTVTIFQLIYFLLMLLVLIPIVSDYTLDAIWECTVQYVYHWTRIQKRVNVILTESTFATLCTGLCLSQVGAVHFISILLLIAGIEPNPGPTSGTEKTKSNADGQTIDPDAARNITHYTSTNICKLVTTAAVHNEVPKAKDEQAKCDVKEIEEPTKSEACSSGINQQTSTDDADSRDLRSGFAASSSNSDVKPKKKDVVSSLRRKLAKISKSKSLTDLTKDRGSLLDISSATVEYIQERNEEIITEETIDSVFIKKEDTKATLCLRNMDLSQEKFDLILKEIDLPIYDVNEIDLSYSTFDLMSWSEHPDGYTNLRRLLTHPRLQYLKTLNLDMGRFSAHDKGGFLISLKNKTLTIPDLRMLHKLLTSVLPDIEVSCVDMHTSVICQKSWGDLPDGLQLLDDLLRHPRLQGAPVLGLEHTGLTSMPQSIAIHHCLTELNISNNELTSIDKSITTCKFLVELNMAVNRLITLPDPFNFPKLEKLNVEHNPMYEIPAVLVQLPSLKFLIIGAPETRTINRQFVRHATGMKCDIQVNATNIDKLKAPTFKQLTKNPEKYMTNYDHAVEQLEGNFPEFLNVNEQKKQF